MGWLIDKIHSWFCKHEFECIVEGQPVYETMFGHPAELRLGPSYHQWIYVCKKCGRKKKITTK